MTALPQHMQALETANRIRLARSNLKRRVRAGEITVVDILTSPPEEALTMSLLVLLSAQARWGRSRALRVIRDAAMSETRRIGEMTVRQRRVLAEYLAGERVDPRGWWS